MKCPQSFNYGFLPPPLPVTNDEFFGFFLKPVQKFSRFAVLVFFFFYSFGARGQSYADSIRIMLEQYPTQDSLRAELLLNFAYHNCFALDMADEVALPAIEEALALSNSIGFEHGIVKAYHHLGLIYRLRGNNEQAAKFLSLAADMSRNKWPMTEASALHQLALLYYTNGDQQESLSQFLLTKAPIQAICDSLLSVEQMVLLQRAKMEEVRDQNTRLAAQNTLLRNRFLTFSSLSAALLILLLLAAYLAIRISNQKNTIQTQKQKLEYLNQTKDWLMGILAHDLREPAIGFADLSKKIKYLIQKGDFNRLNVLGSAVDMAAIDLIQLLDNLLDWSLLQRKKFVFAPKSIDISDLCRSAAHPFFPKLEAKNIILHIQGCDDCYGYGDKHALITVIRNLLSNAIKFSPSGGAITIAATSNEDQLYIDVKDSGPGVSPDQADRIFSFQPDKSRAGSEGEKGVGLGLALSKQIINLQGGDLKLIPNKNGGAVFRVIIPIATVVLSEEIPG